MINKHNKNLTPFARELRQNMTWEEKKLWHEFLKDHTPRFLRQKVIDEYIVDFYCHEARLVVELDGNQHYTEEGLERDEIRTEWIEERNLLVVRIPNREIKQNFNGVCLYIDNLVMERKGK